MSLHPHAVAPVPEQTIGVARAAFRKGSVAMRLRDELGAIYQDDSAHVLAAVRAINRIEGVGETLRDALNSLAVVAPQWLQAHLASDWVDRYRARFNDFHRWYPAFMTPPTGEDLAA